MVSQELTSRTKELAHRCIKLAVSLTSDALGNHRKNQLIRCSTSVAANYRAATLAQSKAAFKAKINIVLEEADETQFWLEFISEENLINPEKIDPLIAEAKEIKTIFYSSRKTLSQ